MRSLCRGWTTQAFYQLRFAGTVLQWRPHVDRRHPDLMSSLEKVKENWRCLLGKLISCINGLVDFFSLNYCILRVTGLANPGLPETWHDLRRCSPVCFPAAAHFGTIGKVTTSLSLCWSALPRGFAGAGMATAEVSRAVWAVGWSLRRWVNQEEGIYSWWWMEAGWCNLHTRLRETDGVPGVLEALLVPYTDPAKKKKLAVR